MNTPALTTPETLSRIRQLALTTAAPHLAHHLGWDVHRLRRTAHRFGIALSEPEQQDTKTVPEPLHEVEHRPRRHPFGGITSEMSLADIAAILPRRQGGLLAALAAHTLNGEPMTGRALARMIGIRDREGLSAPVRGVNSRLREANQPWRIAGSKGPNGGYRLVSVVDEVIL